MQEGKDIKVENKHVDLRWLTLKPALERSIEQWPGLIQYFLTDFPAMQKSISSNKLYKNFFEKLKEHQFLPLIHFLISVARIFSKYLLIFQKGQPLIHILYIEYVSLLQQLMGRFLKADVFSGKSGNEYPQFSLVVKIKWKIVI